MKAYRLIVVVFGMGAFVTLFVLALAIIDGSQISRHSVLTSFIVGCGLGLGTALFVVFEVEDRLLTVLFTVCRRTVIVPVVIGILIGVGVAWWHGLGTSLTFIAGKEFNKMPRDFQAGYVAGVADMIIDLPRLTAKTKAYWGPAATCLNDRPDFADLTVLSLALAHPHDNSYTMAHSVVEALVSKCKWWPIP